MKHLNSTRKSGLITIATILIILIVAVVMTYFLPTDPAEFKAFSLIPAILLIVYIFATKRVVEGLILAAIVGVIMISRPATVGEGTWLMNGFTIFSELLTKTMTETDIPWLTIVCGLMGSIIALIERSGGAHAFGNWAAKKAHSQKSSLLWAWVLGIVIFIDDYLNSLTVGACMTPLTDKYRTPREFLSYIVDSTAAPACVLIPISTWGVFVGKILETNNWAPEGEGLKYFISTIPYSFYAWIALFIVPLAILGIIPKLGPMKQAFKRVEEGGPLAPPGSEKMDIHAGDLEIPDSPKIINMLIPILVLIVSTILLDTDMQQGVIVTLAFMFFFYLVQGVMDAETFVDTCIEGFKNMILPLLLMLLAFLFAAVNSEIHFTEYVINTATSLVTPQFLPAIVFVALAITEFITGTNWGMYVIALPIVIPLAQNLGCNVTIAVAAVLSAGVFGSHICFYSDATVITSAATGCDNLRHAVTQLPYGLLAAALSLVCYLVLGFVL